MYLNLDFYLPRFEYTLHAWSDYFTYLMRPRCTKRIGMSLAIRTENNYNQSTATHKVPYEQAAQVLLQMTYACLQCIDYKVQKGREPMMCLRQVRAERVAPSGGAPGDECARAAAPAAERRPAGRALPAQLLHRHAVGLALRSVRLFVIHYLRPYHYFIYMYIYISLKSNRLSQTLSVH